MVTEDAFAELGLPADATDAQVKAAWRRMVSRWHPDRNASAQAVARMQRVNQAFEAIRRARQQGGPAGATAASEAEPAPPVHEPGPRPEQAANPAPIRRRLHLTLEEAVAGCIKPLRGRYTPMCGACEGRGHHLLAGACPACRGKGTVLQSSVWFGWPSGTAPCTVCSGSGTAQAPCAPCEGRGTGATVAYQVQARIPPGLRDGDVLHVAARRARRSPAPADLEVQVRLAPHPFLRLEPGGDLRCELPVSGFAWMSERTVQVPTLEGMHGLPLRRDQRQYRLAGRGYTRPQATDRGDLVVDIVPVFPEPPSADEDILLDQLIAAGSAPRLREWQRDLRAWGGRRARR